MAKITRKQWDEILSYVNFGSQMARAHDAAFVLIAVAEINGTQTPRSAWVTSGVTDEISVERSEATIATLEHAVRELRARHQKQFGAAPRKRGWNPAGGAKHE